MSCVGVLYIDLPLVATSEFPVLVTGYKNESQKHIFLFYVPSSGNWWYLMPQLLFSVVWNRSPDCVHIAFNKDWKLTQWEPISIHSLPSQALQICNAIPMSHCSLHQVDNVWALMNGVDVTKHLSLIKPMYIDIRVSQTVFWNRIVVFFANIYQDQGVVVSISREILRDYTLKGVKSSSCFVFSVFSQNLF